MILYLLFFLCLAKLAAAPPGYEGSPCCCCPTEDLTATLDGFTDCGCVEFPDSSGAFYKVVSHTGFSGEYPVPFSETPILTGDSEWMSDSVGTAVVEGYNDAACTERNEELDGTLDGYIYVNCTDNVFNRYLFVTGAGGAFTAFLSEGHELEEAGSEVNELDCFTPQAGNAKFTIDTMELALAA